METSPAKKQKSEISREYLEVISLVSIDYFDPKKKKKLREVCSIFIDGNAHGHELPYKVLPSQCAIRCPSWIMADGHVSNMWHSGCTYRQCHGT